MHGEKRGNENFNQPTKGTPKYYCTPKCCTPKFPESKVKKVTPALDVSWISVVSVCSGFLSQVFLHTKVLHTKVMVLALPSFEILCGNLWSSTTFLSVCTAHIC